MKWYIIYKYFWQSLVLNHKKDHMKFRMHLLLLPVLLYCTVFTQAQNAGDKLPLNPKITTGKLPNGLRYLILQNKKPENKIELRLAVNVGSIQEENDEQGLALMRHFGLPFRQ